MEEFLEQVKKDRKWFTKAGYRGFLTSLDSIGLQDQIEQKKQIIGLTVSDTPVIKNIEGTFDEAEGRYKWQVQVDAIMTTTSGYSVYKNVSINMILVYETDNNKPNGLYVHSLNMI